MAAFTRLLESLFQLLPYGGKMMDSPYFITYGALFFIALSAIIMLLAHHFCKKCFANRVWMVIFFLIVGITFLGELAIYMKALAYLTADISAGIAWNAGMMYTDSLTLILLALILFIVYLIDFIIRLTRREKKKKGGNVATE